MQQQVEALLNPSLDVIKDNQHLRSASIVTLFLGSYLVRFKLDSTNCRARRNIDWYIRSKGQAIEIFGDDGD
jgi:hypothetical protein